jgi:Flp pilus assembly protein TadD
VVPFVGFCSLLLALMVALAGQSNPAAIDRRSPEYVGNQACAPCHTAIFDSYARTAMARTSGPALPNLIEGSFLHEPSGVRYHIARDDGHARLSYDRASPALHGTQELEYFVGSNTRGRTFLFRIDGFLYQSPINYYTARHVWDMSPGYTELHEMELNHPVDRTCLFCHASRVQAPVRGTVNRYSGEPFLQPGVGCERCHGPGGDHVAGRGTMVNPAKLIAARRDDICMQCHLEGVARIAAPGRAESDFRPGDRLSDDLAIFVRENAARNELGAVSQFEALALSACKRKSGDAMTCTTCHDPHRQVQAADKPEYYRARCLSCHATMSRGHHDDRHDCTSCHMPRRESADIGHTMVTDHRILRTRSEAGHGSSPASDVLGQFGNPAPGTRELGLAYGELALRGVQSATEHARRLLEEAVRDGQTDADVLTRLGSLAQDRGDFEHAQHYYEEAFARDPTRAVPAADIGVFLARAGKLHDAIALWQDTFDRNPYLTALGLNLARGRCASGDASGARAVLQKALAHNPDSAAGRQLLSALTDNACGRQ